MDKEDIQYQVVAAVITAVDWNQTLQFKGEYKKENNFILGDYPSNKKVNTLIPLAIIGQIAVVRALPKDVCIFKRRYNPRRIFQKIVIFGEYGAYQINKSIGIKFEL